MMTRFGHTKHVTNWEIGKPPTYGRLNSKSKNPMTGDIPWCCQGPRRSSAEAVPWIPWLPQHNFLLKELKGYDESVSQHTQSETNYNFINNSVTAQFGNQKEQQTEIPPHTDSSLLCFRSKIWKTGSQRKISQYNHTHHLLNNVRIKSAQFPQLDLTQTENIEFTKTVWHITYTSSSLLPCPTPEGIERKKKLRIDVKWT